MCYGSTSGVGGDVDAEDWLFVSYGVGYKRNRVSGAGGGTGEGCMVNLPDGYPI